MNGRAFAPVAPVQVLQALLDKDPSLFGTYHLLLAHHTLEEGAKFRTLFQEVQKVVAAGDLEAPIVIMDNSIVELGNSVSFESVRDACRIIKEACPAATVIAVLPDVMGDGEATRDAVFEAYQQWTTDITCADEFMAVCQGKDWEDYEASLNVFINQEEFPKITWLGVPRILHKTLGTRTNAAIRAGYHEGVTHKVHLLGFSDDPVDDKHAAQVTGIFGIDSAVPLRVDDNWNPLVKYPPRDPNWFAIAEFDELMEDNLLEARAFFSGPHIHDLRK